MQPFLQEAACQGWRLRGQSEIIGLIDVPPRRDRRLVHARYHLRKVVKPEGRGGPGDPNVGLHGRRARDGELHRIPAT